MDNLNSIIEKFSTFRYNEVTDTNYKEVCRQIQWSEKYVKFVEFRYTLFTKLFNFNYVELDQQCTALRQMHG
jgi:hypothetical protein